MTATVDTERPALHRTFGPLLSLALALGLGIGLGVAQTHPAALACSCPTQTASDPTPRQALEAADAVFDGTDGCRQSSVWSRTLGRPSRPSQRMQAVPPPPGAEGSMRGEGGTPPVWTGHRRCHREFGAGPSRMACRVGVTAVGRVVASSSIQAHPHLTRRTTYSLRSQDRGASSSPLFAPSAQGEAVAGCTIRRVRHEARLRLPLCARPRRYRRRRHAPASRRRLPPSRG